MTDPLLSFGWPEGNTGLRNEAFDFVAVGGFIDGELE